MAEIYQLPEGNNNGNATIPFSIPIGFGGMGNNGFGFGNGMNGIYDLLGVAAVVAMAFPYIKWVFKKMVE